MKKIPGVRSILRLQEKFKTVRREPATCGEIVKEQLRNNSHVAETQTSTEIQNPE